MSHLTAEPQSFLNANEAKMQSVPHCESIYSQIAKMQAIDWDFSEAKTKYLTHGIHPYPAKYIPQIPNAIIQALSRPGETVADIFCGSGTTLVEALLLQRNAVGIDANPLACLISQAKTAPLTTEDKNELLLLVKRSQELSNGISLDKGLFREKNPFVSTAERPEDEALIFWFEPFVIEELAELLSWCKLLASETSRHLAFTAFSSIVVSVSKQDSDTRYVRRDKSMAPGDVCRKFALALAEAIRSATEFTETLTSGLNCTIHQANLLNQPEIGLVDLVVCSPPYPNAYSYHLYHMTRMIWLGMDQPKFKKEEIGSHRKYSSKSVNGATVETFKTEMSIIFDWLHHHLRPGRFACFVVGDSTIRSQRISNADLISTVASRHGFCEMARIYRRMKDSKKSFNPIIGKIKQEQLIILQNGRS